MNKSKVEAEAYIQFLVASQTNYSCTEAERVQPEGETPIAHDAYTRLLHRLEPDAETLWQESAPQVDSQAGVLILDDTTPDKPYAHQMGGRTRTGACRPHLSSPSNCVTPITIIPPPFPQPLTPAVQAMGNSTVKVEPSPTWLLT